MIKHLPIYLVAALLVAAVFLFGRAQDSAYHTVGWQPNNCIDDASSDKCVSSYYQEHEGYDLAFAEFSERGNAFNDKHIEEVLARIESRAKIEGMILVTFVHGWTHNADEEDRNLIDFKHSLQRISNSDTVRESGRRVVGLYLGWRGASIDVPWLENITFWDRKAVAEEVGKGGVTRLLLELAKIDSDNDSNNVFVVIGHSFGGAIVVSALTEVLAERVVHRTKGHDYGATIGDAVIVLNPAIEATQALHFVEAAIKEEFPEDQHPLFISISTDGDGATHQLFPLGQSVSLLLTWHQHDLERSYYYDREDGKKLVLKEEHLDATTVGNFAPFLTHRLTASSDGEDAQFVLKPCQEVPEECIPKGFTSLSGQPTIKDLPANYPLFFIKTDENVMKDHNDIFNPKIHAFMLTIIDDVVRRSLSAQEKTREESTGSILNDPSRMALKSNEFFKKLQEEERMKQSAGK